MSILLLTIKLKLRLTVIFDLETRTVKFWTWNQNKSLIRLKLFLFIRFFMSYFRVASKAWNVWVFFLKKTLQDFKILKLNLTNSLWYFFGLMGVFPLVIGLVASRSKLGAYLILMVVFFLLFFWNFFHFS